jgi:hypothetical protein
MLYEDIGQSGGGQLERLRGDDILARPLPPRLSQWVLRKVQIAFARG